MIERKHTAAVRIVAALAAALVIPGSGAGTELARPMKYSLPSLPDGPRHRRFRTLAEVTAAGRQILENYSDGRTASAGFLDVTKSPYLARGDGVTDDTAALQRALFDARDARLVVWLPPGTYLVRDTLQCVQGAIEWRLARGDDPKADRAAVALEPGAEDRLSAWDFPSVIRGPGGPERAVIRLAPDAKGFDDPARPRPLIFLWARQWDPPHDRRGNVSFNQMLIGVDLDIRGHAGAIGVDMQGAQGTATQDVHIEAGGAFAGMRGLIGSGGSTHGLTVHGGRYGIYAAEIAQAVPTSGSQPSPLLAAATLTGQTVASIHYAGRGPLTVVGAKIEGRGIVCDGAANPYDGALNVIDSTLDLAGGGAVSSNRPVYIANSFVRGAVELVDFPDGTPAPLDASGWTEVREYAGAPAGPFPLWINGKRQSAPVADVVNASAGPSPDLQSRHALPGLPAWNAPGVANAGAAPYAATGDNRTDDAPAIQRALDENEVVFLSKGRYRLGRPLHLAAGRKLIGAGKSYTALLPLPNAPAFSDPARPQPLVDTDAAADADTLIALLQFAVFRPGAYALRWRVGGRAAVRDVNFRCGDPDRVPRGANIVVEGNGGGRWFNFFSSDMVTCPDYRQMLVRGTRQPIIFYMFNPEHTRSDVMTEFVDTRGVTIYSLKGESFVIGQPDRGTRPLLRVRDSAGFRLYGGGGICGAASGDRPYIYRFENSHDLLVANPGHQFHERYFAVPKTWSILSEARDGHETATPGDEYFVLYRTTAQP